MGGGGGFCPICKIYWGILSSSPKKSGGILSGGILSGYLKGHLQLVQAVSLISFRSANTILSVKTGLKSRNNLSALTQ